MNDTDDSLLIFHHGKTYDRLKWGTTIVLPASGTLYFALSRIWGWPNGEEVLGTIIALQAFFGVLLGLSSSAYRNSEARFDGTIRVHINEHGRRTASLEVKGDPHEMLETKKQAVFKVDKPEGGE